MRRALPFILSIAILAVLCALVDWKQVGSVFSWDRIDLLLWGVMFYLLSMLFRAVRFNLVICRFTDRKLPFVAGWDLATIGTFANHVMPMRSGEAVFVFLTRYAHHVPLDRGTVALLTARLYDLVAITAVFLGGLIAMGVIEDLRWLGTLAALLVLLLAAAVRMDLAVVIGRKVLGQMLKTVGVSERPKAKKLLAFADQLQGGLHVLRQPMFVLQLVLLSAGVWLAMAASFWQMLASFGLPMPLDAVIVGSIGATLSGLLPINAAGSLGTLEAAWTAGFMAVGMDRSTAIASGLAMHVVVIVVTGIVAALSFLRLGPQTWQGFRRRSLTVSDA